MAVRAAGCLKAQKRHLAFHESHHWIDPSLESQSSMEHVVLRYNTVTKQILRRLGCLPPTSISADPAIGVDSVHQIGIGPIYFEVVFWEELQEETTHLKGFNFCENTSAQPKRPKGLTICVIVKPVRMGLRPSIYQGPPRVWLRLSINMYTIYQGNRETHLFYQKHTW